MSLRIQSECEKLWTRTTPNTNTFHAVHITEKDWRLLFDFFYFLFLFIEFIISNFLLNLANFICYLSFCLRAVVYFSYIFAWLLQQMEVTLAKSLLLCKSFGKLQEIFQWFDSIKITFVCCFPGKSTYNCRVMDIFSNIVVLLLLLLSCCSY